MSAVLLMAYVPGQVKKTPLDVNSTTHLSGDAVYLGAERVPVKAISHTVADGKKSDGDVIVFDTFSCLVRDPDGNAPDCVKDDDSAKRLITASTDTFATNRVTAVATDNAKYLPADATAHQGLVNKWPFGSERKTYPYWDGLLGRAVDASYVGDETLNGLVTYKYQVKVENEAAEVSSGVQGTYSDDKTLWIEPKTGTIIKQSEHQVRMLTDGTSALDMNLAFTDDQVAKNVKDTKSSVSQLNLVGILPPILGLLSLICLAVGIFLLREPSPDTGQGRRVAPQAATT